MRISMRLQLVVFLLAVVNSLNAQGPQSQTPGRPVQGGPPVRESVGAIQERQKRTPPEHPEVENEILRDKRRPGNPQNPDARPGVQWPPRQPGTALQQPLRGGQGPYLAQTTGTSFTGATLSGVNPTNGYYPPDTMGTVGPTQFIVIVNGRIVSFNKTTGIADGVINATTNTFFNSVRNASGTSDPRIRYDRLSQRWFVVTINVSTPNRILIAVSNSSTITISTVFTFFFIPIEAIPPTISATCLADYPTLGIDANAVYIGTNNFCGTPQTYNSTDGYVIRKSDLLAGTLTTTVFRGLVANSAAPGPYTPQAVDNYDPAATEGYFIGVDSATFSTLMLRRVSNPGGTPSISANISIATPLPTQYPLLVDHLGKTGSPTAHKLDGLDDRLLAAHIRNGRLWTAHSIGVDNTGNALGTRTRNAVRWYELSGIASPGTPAFVQAGTIFTSNGTNDTAQLNYWMPSVMVSGQGHAALGFSTAGTNERINAGYAGRLLSDTLGTVQAPVNYTASTTAYNPGGDNGGSSGRRWGDYSYTSLDPDDDMTMWTIQEFCEATNSYGVRVVRLVAPPPAAVNSASVSNGLASAPVTLSGTSASGSGFFDPGSGFANRLAVTIPGVVVNSATYVNPTTINLSLNTVGVAAGNYTMQVANPDGQTSSGTLTVTQPAGTTPTTTALASSLNPSVFGSSVTFTATVSPAAATGTVSFKNGGVTIGTGTLPSGTATFSTSALTVATHPITAVYEGDPTYASSTSPTLLQTVTEKKRRGQTVSESARVIAPQE
ncbi:MAG TPA: Ig-like domain-containing protein [Terriglobales bacterium]|nr:Ig-like domain-containing protein [Terriglobales bacterium]